MATKRNAIGVLMGVELVLNAANVNFVGVRPLQPGVPARRAGLRAVGDRAGGGRGGGGAGDRPELLQQPRDRGRGRGRRAEGLTGPDAELVRIRARPALRRRHAAAAGGVRACCSSAARCGRCAGHSAKRAGSRSRSTGSAAATSRSRPARTSRPRSWPLAAALGVAGLVLAPHRSERGDNPRVAVGGADRLGANRAPNLRRPANANEVAAADRDRPAPTAARDRCEVGYHIDHLAAVMFVMVTFIATLILLFSIGYMSGRSCRRRSRITRSTADTAATSSAAGGSAGSSCTCRCSASRCSTWCWRTTCSRSS